jgi:sugar lactone lactonase YvrE
MRISGIYLRIASTRMIAAAAVALLAACGGGGGGTSSGGGSGTPPVTPPPPATPGVSLLAGYLYGNPYVDATGAAARFNQPGSFVLDSLGNIWVEDVDPSVNPSAGTGQQTTLRVVSPTGVVTTMLRDARPTTPVNGVGYAGLVADGYGNVYEEAYSAAIASAIGGPVPAEPLLGQPYSTLNPAVPAPNLPANRQCQGINPTLTCFFAMNRQGTLIGFTDFGVGDSSMVAYAAGQPLVNLGARGIATPWTDGGPPTGTFDQMSSLTFDANNTGYFVDSFSPPAFGESTRVAIRSFTQQGTFSTLISGGQAYVDGGPGAAGINVPSVLQVDGAGNIYFTDIKEEANTLAAFAAPIYIRKLTPNGAISTVAGPFSGVSSDPGSYPLLLFNVDSGGNIYLFQQQQLLKIAPGGTPAAFAGLAYPTGSQDGAGGLARFVEPLGVTTDAAGNTYVADCGANTVRKIDSSGNTITLAGVAGQAGSVDGVGSAARLNCPRAIVADGLGNVYVTQDYLAQGAQSAEGALRMINTTSGAVTTVGVTRALTASSLAIDASGKIYTNDLVNNAFRVYDPKAQTFTFLAQGAFNYGFNAITNPHEFRGLAIDAKGSLYAIDPVDGMLRKIDQQGNVTNLPGAGGAIVFPFNAGIAIDASGKLYVTDPLNHVIREIAPDGTTTIAAGSPTAYFAQTGVLPASLGTPVGLALRLGTSTPQLVVSDQNAILSVVLP